MYPLTFTICLFIWHYLIFLALLFLLLLAILADSVSVKYWSTQGKAPGPLDVSLSSSNSQIAACITITGGLVSLQIEGPHSQGV